METSPKSSPPRFRRFSEIQPRDIYWLWEDWLARRKLTLLVGVPDIGKTTLGIDIAARLSRGDNWPDGTSAPMGQTLILSAEDDPEDTLAVLLGRHDADLDKVAVIEAVRRGDALAPMKDQLSEIAEILKDEPFDLLQIHPLTAFLGKASRSNDAEMRTVLTLLSDFAREQDTAVLTSMHPRAGSGRSKAIDLIRGSATFSEAGRVVWMAIDAPDNHADVSDNFGQRKFLGIAKNNVAKHAKALIWSLPDDQPVKWHGETVINFDVAATRPDRAALTDHREDVLRFIHERGCPITPQEAAERSNKDPNTARKHLHDMRKAGLLTTPVKGYYDDAKKPTLPPDFFTTSREKAAARAAEKANDGTSGVYRKPTDMQLLKHYIKAHDNRRARKQAEADDKMLFGT